MPGKILGHPKKTKVRSSPLSILGAIPAGSLIGMTFSPSGLRSRSTGLTACPDPTFATCHILRASVRFRTALGPVAVGCRVILASQTRAYHQQPASPSARSPSHALAADLLRLTRSAKIAWLI